MFPCVSLCFPKHSSECFPPRKGKHYYSGLFRGGSVFPSPGGGTTSGDRERAVNTTEYDNQERISKPQGVQQK